MLQIEQFKSDQNSNENNNKNNRKVYEINKMHKINLTVSANSETLSELPLNSLFFRLVAENALLVHRIVANSFEGKSG